MISDPIVDALEDDIRRHVEEDNLLEALKKLRTFSIDYNPELRNGVSVLMSRFNRYARERASGTTKTDKITDISSAVLEMLTVIRSTAIAPEIALVPPVHRAVGDDRGRNVAAAPPAATFHDTNELRRDVIRRRADETPGASVILEGVEKIYDKSGFRLGPVDCTLKPGQVTVLFGNNGSGKTTLLRIIAGDMTASAGTLKYFGSEGAVDWIAVKSQIAFISSRQMGSRETVRETLEFVAAACGKLGKANKDDVDDYLARYDLETLADKGWWKLSDGYQMRVDLIRSLLASPRLLILDEPLAHLDFNARATLLSELVELTAIFSSPASILLSTHHIEEAELIADQLIVLEQGKSRFCGTKEQFRQAFEGSTFHILGAQNALAPEKFERIPGLRQANSILGGVELTFDERMTLKELFERMKDVELGGISSISDVSGSPRNILARSTQA